MIVAVYNRTFGKEDIPAISKILTALQAHKIQLVFYKDFYTQLKDSFAFEESPSFFTSRLDLPLQTDMLISLGGDGTMLDTVSFIGDSNIPLIGINLGRLGFLAAISENEAADAIESLVRGSYTIEKRSLLHLESSMPIFKDAPFALNEFTLHRKDSSSMIKIHTYLNGEFLNTYWADGLIVATPTGSTGYSLSCGGPVLTPEVASFVVTPMAPHNLNARPLVITDDTEITLKVSGREEQFLISLDSRIASVSIDTTVYIKKAPFSLSIIEFKEETFLATIRKKLLWGADKRN